MWCVGQVLAISRYDGRGAITLQDSVKSQHILPFFPNFVAWARRLEELLVGTDAEAEGAAQLPGMPASRQRMSCTDLAGFWAILLYLHCACHGASVQGVCSRIGGPTRTQDAARHLTFPAAFHGCRRP